jgi:hypothetical protein
VKTAELRLASDAQLVVAIGRFRHDALSEVYRRHAPAVFGLARRIVGDGALAEEVVHEVFLRLWNLPDRFDTRPEQPPAVPARPDLPALGADGRLEPGAADLGRGARPGPGVTAFRVHSPVAGFAITDEVSPGVVSPGNPALIQGVVS